MSFLKSVFNAEIGVYIIIRKFIKRLLKKKTSNKQVHHQPIIVPRGKHTLSDSNISLHAVKVLNKLHEAGFSAYLVGGCVRDLLLGKKPKDFDVATNAHPEQIRKLFKNCRLVGRRFRLAHVFFGKEIIEVATFRAAHEAETEASLRSKHGMLLLDNVYGNIEDDAWRRDFTLNALYYNIVDASVIDYCGGAHDLAAKVIRLIGEPIERYREDPVRILRAIRFAGKLGFSIDATTEAPITESRELLLHVSPSRLFEEILKLFESGHSVDIYELLKKYRVFELLFKQAHDVLNDKNYPWAEPLLYLAFKNTDQRIQVGKHINSAFLLAVILWYPLQKITTDLQKQGSTRQYAWEHAMSSVINAQLKQILIPKRLIAVIRDMWQFQYRLERRLPSRIYNLIENPRFRAAYDLLVLRAQAGEAVKEAADWWTLFQEKNAEERKKLINSLAQGKPKNKRRRRKRKSPAIGEAAE